MQENGSCEHVKIVIMLEMMAQSLYWIKILLFSDTCDESENPDDEFMIKCCSCDIALENAEMLSKLESKVSHLDPSQ